MCCADGSRWLNLGKGLWCLSLLVTTVGPDQWPENHLARWRNRETSRLSDVNQIEGTSMWQRGAYPNWLVGHSCSRSSSQSPCSVTGLITMSLPPNYIEASQYNSNSIKESFNGRILYHRTFTGAVQAPFHCHHVKEWQTQDSSGTLLFIHKSEGTGEYSY